MSDDTERWRIIRHNLACRSGHRCELYGVRLGPGQEGTVHHRRPRGKGGSRATDVDSLANLLLLCGGALGGVCGCHGHVETRPGAVYDIGWLVHQGHDPSTTPVLLYRRRTWALLHPTVPCYLAVPDAA